MHDAKGLGLASKSKMPWAEIGGPTNARDSIFLSECDRDGIPLSFWDPVLTLLLGDAKDTFHSVLCDFLIAWLSLR